MRGLRELLNQASIAEGRSQWMTVAGTKNGFVYFYDESGVSEAFLSTSSDAGVPPLPDGGYPGFVFPSGIAAIDGHAISDDSATGGVGVALLFFNQVSFAYVSSDGATHLGPGKVFSHSYAAGDQYDITVFGGSFGVSLYDSVAHSNQMAASGCTP